MEELQRLRRDLAELAYALERQGRLDSADLANAVSRQLAELTAVYDAKRWEFRTHREGIAADTGLWPPTPAATP